MAGASQPGAEGGNPFGSVMNSLAAPEFREGLALWANGLRLNPDPNMAAMIDRRQASVVPACRRRNPGCHACCISAVTLPLRFGPRQ